MTSSAKTPDEYIDQLPEDRKDPISTLKTQASNGSYSPALVDAIRSIYRLDKSLEPAEQD